MGIRQCGMPLGGVIASVLLPAIAAHFDYRWAVAAAGIATIVTSTIASALYREPTELEGRRSSVRAMLAEMVAMLRDVRLVYITITSMVLVSAQVAVMGFFTLALVQEASYSIARAALMFTIATAGAIAGRLSWGWSSDHVFRGSRAVPLALVCIVSAVTLLLIAYVTPATPAWWVVALAFFAGFSTIGWFGLVVVALAEIGGDEHAGSALGAGLTWCFAASVAAPMIFGAIVETRGYPFAWLSTAALLAFGVAPALLASRVAHQFARSARAA